MSTYFEKCRERVKKFEAQTAERAQVIAAQAQKGAEMNQGKQKQTPGSWYVANTGNDQGLIVSEGTGRNVAVVYDKKDAPLIAAGPDLLGALEDCCRGMRSLMAESGNVRRSDEWAIARARAAIRKATGDE